MYLKQLKKERVYGHLGMRRLRTGSLRLPFIKMTIGIAAGMMIMAATALGLGSVTVSSVRHGFIGSEGPALKKLIGLTGSDEVILSLAIGYTDNPKQHEMKGSAKNNVRIINK